jgi:hypothetical protein
MTETTLKRQYITDADGTPVGVILPMDEFALVKDWLEQRFPDAKESEQKTRTDLPNRTIKDTEFFGMWADREDMAGRSSREWLENLRARQWSSR